MKKIWWPFALAGLVTAATTPGCGYFFGGCGEENWTGEVVPLPEGTHGPASYMGETEGELVLWQGEAHIDTTWSNDGSTFSTISQVPSASLSISLTDETVVRRYVRADGSEVRETWRKRK